MRRTTLARRLALPALTALTAAAAFGLPAAADAAVVTKPIGLDRFTLLAAPGEANRVRVSDDGPGFIRIRDELPLAKDTSRCESITRTELRCEAQSTTSVVLLLGDSADRTEVASTRRVGMEGGAGNDTYAGGTAAGRSNVLFRGGADFDTATYHDATAGVTVGLGDGPGDGRTARDSDEIADVERVIGSRFGDGLDASRAQPAVGAELDGGIGNDILTGGEERDVLVSGLGIDFLSSRGGIDRIVASDGDRDTVDCGTGAPDEALVSPFGESSISGCERVVPVRGGATATTPLIGTLTLTPTMLSTRPGQPARLKLSWRHPRSWKQLRRVTLRLYRGEARVGEVAISPGTHRINGRGAVTVLRRRTHLAHKGKDVSARLAVRLDRGLAGRKLRVAVEAVDVRGARQLEARAAIVRVTR